LVLLIGAEMNVEIVHASPRGNDAGEKVRGQKRRSAARTRRLLAAMTPPRFPSPHHPQRSHLQCGSPANSTPGQQKGRHPTGYSIIARFRRKTRDARPFSLTTA
jgi:hypothetical protein